MLKFRWRKRKELTKKWWVGTVELIALGIALVTICVFILGLIPSVRYAPDFGKLLFSSGFIFFVAWGILNWLRKLWKIKG